MPIFLSFSHFPITFPSFSRHFPVHIPDGHHGPRWENDADTFWGATKGRGQNHLGRNLADRSGLKRPQEFQMRYFSYPKWLYIVCIIYIVYIYIFIHCMYVYIYIFIHTLYNIYIYTFRRLCCKEFAWLQAWWVIQWISYWHIDSIYR